LGESGPRNGPNLKLIKSNWACCVPLPPALLLTFVRCFERCTSEFIDERTDGTTVGDFRYIFNNVFKSRDFNPSEIECNLKYGVTIKEIDTFNVI